MRFLPKWPHIDWYLRTLGDVDLQLFAHWRRYPVSDGTVEETLPWEAPGELESTALALQSRVHLSLVRTEAFLHGGVNYWSQHILDVGENLGDGASVQFLVVSQETLLG